MLQRLRLGLNLDACKDKCNYKGRCAAAMRPFAKLLWKLVICFVEISKAVDMYLFLFDDILLLTRVKKAPRKVTSLPHLLMRTLSL